MSRIEKLFSERQKNILNVYCTAGYPELDSTVEVLLALQDHGADLVEIGIPYSDPLADGPTIQRASERALRNGATLAGVRTRLRHPGRGTLAAVRRPEASHVARAP